MYPKHHPVTGKFIGPGGDKIYRSKLYTIILFIGDSVYATGLYVLVYKILSRKILGTSYHCGYHRSWPFTTTPETTDLNKSKLLIFYRSTRSWMIITFICGKRTSPKCIRFFKIVPFKLPKYLRVIVYIFGRPNGPYVHKIYYIFNSSYCSRLWPVNRKN